MDWAPDLGPRALTWGEAPALWSRTNADRRGRTHDERAGIRPGAAMTRERWRRGDRGASVAEYAAILMVGALILWTLVYVAVPDHVMRVLPPELCRIFGGNCQTQPVQSDEDFKPPICERTSEQQKFGAVIKVAVVKIGDEYAFLRQEMADGSVRLTVIPTTGELGLEVGVGGKLNLGKNLKLGADVTVAGSIKAGIGDTYVFKNAQEADDFEGRVKEISYR